MIRSRFTKGAGVESPPPPDGARICRRLEARAITVHFEGIAALSDVSIAVDQRDIVGLIGPNGAGKTTLINVMSGFQKPSQGLVRLNERTANGWSPERFRKRGVARTFQSGRLFRHLTVRENVEAPAVNLGLTRRGAKAHADDLLGWVGLAKKTDARADTLTYTDERRLGLARALAVSPQFLLLDEPAAGMSDEEADELMRLIVTIPQSFSCGILLIEHNMRVVMGVSKSVHVLDGGRTIAAGAPEEVRSNEATIAAYLGSAWTRRRASAA